MAFSEVEELERPLLLGGETTAQINQQMLEGQY